MKIIILCLMILAGPFFAHADDFFQEKELHQLRLIAISMENESATLRDDASNEAIVFLWDRIGAEGWEVVELSKGHIIVELGDRLVRILKVCGFAETQ